MRELVFFPTPNWFISRSIDVNKSNGSLAITAINSIILTSNLFDEYNYTIKEAHSKRLHAVAFGPESTNLLASCSEDFDVKIWNLTTRALHLQHKLHQVQKTTTLSVTYKLILNILKLIEFSYMYRLVAVWFRM